MNATAEAKRENTAMNLSGCSIHINRSERRCVNCTYYEQYFRQNRGNLYGWVATCDGYCMKHECKRGALRQPCKDFERRMK